MLQELQIQWIHQIHHLMKSPEMDRFFRFLDFFDTTTFYMLLIPVLWTLVSYRFGLAITFICNFSNFMNRYMKELFGLPRPFQLDPTLTMIPCGEFGFPSGAAQGSVLLSLILYHHIRNPFTKFFAVFYPLLIGFSRIYLGLHFFTDVVVGWAVGAGLFWFYLKGYPLVVEFIRAQSYGRLVLVSHGLMIFATFNATREYMVSYAIQAAALTLGIAIANKNHLYPLAHTKIWEKISLLTITLLGMIFAVVLQKTYHLGYLVILYPVCIWISLAAPLVHRIFFKRAILFPGK